MKINKQKMLLNNYKLLIILCCMGGVMLLQSCHNKKTKGKKIVISSAPDTHEFAEKLSTIFAPVDSPGKKQLNDIAWHLRFAYQQNEYAPIWLNTGKPTENAQKLLAELGQLYWDGLDTARYNITHLRTIVADSTLSKDIIKQIGVDTLFTLTYLHASHDLLFGIVTPKSVDSLWHHPNDSAWTAYDALAKRDNAFPSLANYRSKLPTYAMMQSDMKHYADISTDSQLLDAIEVVHDMTNYAAISIEQRKAVLHVIKTELPWLQSLNDSEADHIKQAISNYQYYMDVNASGKLDSFTAARLSRSTQQIMDVLRINMERARWMQQEVGNLYIVIDIPAMELFFRKDAMDVMHMRTVVGKLERQTPSIGASMANVVINPPWGVPPTILKKDVLPGLTKKGKKYLDEKGLKVYDKKGKEIDPSRVNKKNYDNYVYKQDPGDDNALGYVKFNLPNPWDIYLHDTPHRGDFVKRNRFLSSGCVRLEQPQQMALYILSDLEKKRYTQERLDSVIDTHKTRWEILKNKIPVHIVYLTNFEDSNSRHLRYLRDIYGRDEHLQAMIK